MIFLFGFRLPSSDHQDASAPDIKFFRAQLDLWIEKKIPSFRGYNVVACRFLIRESTKIGPLGRSVLWERIQAFVLHNATHSLTSCIVRYSAASPERTRLFF